MKTWIIILISVMSLAAQENKPLDGKCYIIGHRGAPAYGGENTLWGFQKALDLGADGFELDVIPTSDGKLIVGHDFDLKRLIGEAQLKAIYPEDNRHYVTEFTQAELQNFKVVFPPPGKEPYEHAELSNEYRMPLLEEALDLLIDQRVSAKNPNLKIYIEIKTKEGYMNTVSLNEISYVISTALADKNLLDDKNIWIQSFDFEMMDVIAANPLLNNTPKCQLAFDGIGEIRNFRKAKKANKFLKRKIVNRNLQMFHVWKVPSKYVIENKGVEFIQIAHKLDIPIHLYTFRDPRHDSDYKIMSALGVSGFESAEEELLYFMRKGVDAVMSDDVVSALKAREMAF